MLLWTAQGWPVICAMMKAEYRIVDRLSYRISCAGHRRPEHSVGELELSYLDQAEDCGRSYGLGEEQVSRIAL
jgi:hypothetical protein